MDTVTVCGLLLAKLGAEETFSFDLVTLVARVGGKLFALLALTDTPLRLTFKCDPHTAPRCVLLTPRSSRATT